MHNLKRPINNEIRIGEKYRIAHKGMELYDAELTNYDGGCWGTVKVENILDSPNKKVYKEGQSFDIKVAMYEFFEVPKEVSKEASKEASDAEVK